MQNENRRFQILLVDDDATERTGVRFLIEKLKFPLDVKEASNGKRALEVLSNTPVDILFTDVKMPYIDGLELSSIVNSQYPHIKIIIFSAYGEFDYAKRAMEANVVNYLLKPVDVEEFQKVIGSVVNQCIDDEYSAHQRTRRSLAAEKLHWINLLTGKKHLSVPLPEDMLTIPRSGNMKNRCLMAYTSQYSSYIGSFAKADEFFWARDFSNLAYKATVTAYGSQAGADAANVADGIIGGYLGLPDSDWITDGTDVGAWIQMDWAEGQNINSIILHGSMDSAYGVTSGVLEFSDGTSIPVGELPAYGKPMKVSVDLDGITWVRFVISGTSGERGALSEWEVF